MNKKNIMEIPSEEVDKTESIAIISSTHFKATSTGLIIEGEPSVENWLEYGEKIKQVQGAIQWVLGDWLNYGERAYGEKYSQALDETGYSYDTLRHVALVAVKVEPSRRKHNLSWSHHLEVIKLNPDEQDFWLGKAEEENLSTKQLRAAIQRDKREKGLQERIGDTELQPAICQGDCAICLDKMPECDMLLTEPPDGRQTEDIPELVDKWFYKALKKVKDTGHAYIILSGHPEELKAYLDAKIPNSLSLAQILIWHYKNTSLESSRDDYYCNYQPVLYFRGRNSENLCFPTPIQQWTVQAINDKQELVRRFILHSTEEGNTVLDPFAGRGNFILEACSLGRKGCGCETDNSLVEIACHMGCQKVEGSLVGAQVMDVEETEKDAEAQDEQPPTEEQQKIYDRDINASKKYNLWAQMWHKINSASVKACGFNLKDLMESDIPPCFWKKGGAALDVWCRENRDLLNIYDDAHDRTDLPELFINALKEERQGEIVTVRQKEAHMDAECALAEGGIN